MFLKIATEIPLQHQFNLVSKNLGKLIVLTRGEKGSVAINGDEVVECDVQKNISYITRFFPEKAKVINDDWSLVEGEFKVTDSKNPVYITSEGRNSEKSWLYVDDLLIYEAGDTIYKLNNETRVLFYNNHTVKL